jgi:hypothetical protein
VKIIKVLTMVAIIILGVLGWRWYSYVTNAESPYNEVGIELNSRMPSPIRKWGCDKLHETFGNVLPPYGCQADGNGQQWL